jgi:hypothetical protein
MPTPTPPPDFNIEKDLNAYLAFETQKTADKDGLQAKIAIWKHMSASPETLLMLFCVMIMDSGGPFDNMYGQKTGMKGSSSITKIKGEDLIEETGKMMNYVTDYRNAATDMKNQLDLGKEGKGDIAKIDADLKVMAQFWNSDIFKGSSGDTFNQASSDIQAVLNDIGPGKTFASLSDLWTTSQLGPNDPGYDPAKVTQAGTDIQKMTNGINNLFSMTSVNSNALGAQLQNAEGDYKSYLSVIEKMMQSLNQIITQSIQRTSTN